jgi:2,4-dienoyl-CoA reductase-like NADH-dependent reductase (Old Yellow Enzyme family)
MSVPVTDSIDSARPLLFLPFKVRGLTLKNRLVVPPMVHYRAGPGSTCSMFHNVHLGRYALGGFGLVFVEATAVEEIGLINEHDLGTGTRRSPLYPQEPTSSVRSAMSEKCQEWKSVSASIGLVGRAADS